MISLWLMIALLLICALGFISYALRDKKIIIALGLIVMLASLTLYHFLGNAQGLKNAQLLQQFNTLAEQGADDTAILQALIDGLKKQLKLHPDDPITYALLGKIYFTLGDYAQASSSFAAAYTLLPDDHEFLIDYATAYYLAKDGIIDSELSYLLSKVKKLKPTLDSLSLLANVALASGDTETAIRYWQVMQAMVDKNSDLYKELVLTINFAQGIKE